MLTMISVTQLGGKNKDLHLSPSPSPRFPFSVVDPAADSASSVHPGRPKIFYALHLNGRSAKKLTPSRNKR